MCKFFYPLAGAALLVAFGAALSAADDTSGLVHGASALRTVTDRVADPAARAASGDAARRAQAAPGRAPLLLSPFGHLPAPPAESLPADSAVRTRSGLYATRQQADDLDGQFGGAAVWVDVACCGAEAIAVAQGHVAGMMAAHDLAGDAPVFVLGANLHAAALLADRLSDQRLTRVFLITQ
jgi:hypothetical protein